MSVSVGGLTRPSRKLKKSPHLMRSGTGQSGAPCTALQRAGCVTMVQRINDVNYGEAFEQTKRAGYGRPD
jgi:hypothetical protein